MKHHATAGRSSNGVDWGQLAHDMIRTPLNILLIAMIVAPVLRSMQAGPVWVFVVSGIAIIPLAGLMGRATENLAETMGAGPGGLLNATFGNAAELIIALFALWKGPHMYPLVKASITGSIIGNSLLVLGFALVVGGLAHDRQRFNATAASLGATMLSLASIGLLVPTLYYYVFHAKATLDRAEILTIESISEEIAVVLAVTYLLSLIFSLKTHRHLFAGEEAEQQGTGEGHHPEWNRTTSLLVLAISTLGVAWMSELLVGSVEAASHSLNLTDVFVGVVVVAIVGNAAEHSTAILVARKNKMDLSMNIAVGSSIQIALFAAPVLVFASMAMGHEHPLDLHFTPMEVIAVIASVVVLNQVCQDGETHWMEGVMLLAVYIILGLAFYHLPESTGEMVGTHAAPPS